MYLSLQDRNLKGRRLNSGILGTSVANLSISNLTNRVFITLRNNEPVPVSAISPRDVKIHPFFYFPSLFNV